MRKNQVINITLSEELLNATDKQAEIELRNRSELVREALRMYLVNKNATGNQQAFSSEEIDRVNEIKKFSDFTDHTTLALSCSFRPQPNKIDELFAGRESELINYIENPKSFRRMGWDLRTLGTAKPVAGEYLEITNGDRKIIRIYRDGQVVFAASEDFFGHGVNTDEDGQKDSFLFNSMACAETISNFVNFSLEISRYLSNDASGVLYKITIFNPQRKNLELISAGTFKMKIGELSLGLADREVFVSSKNIEAKKAAYKFWAELNFLFGISEDKFEYVNKADKLMGFSNFSNNN